MATNTPNYNLIKPAGNDPVNIADINGNSDIIDTTLKNLNDRILPVATIVQAQAGTDNTRVMTPLSTNATFSFRNYVGSNVDLNTITSTSRFFFSSNTISANFPPGFNVGLSCQLEVLSNNNSNLPIQKLYQSTSGLSWSRIRLGTASSSLWSSWRLESFEVATQTQAQEGTDNTALMTPLRTKQAIDNSPIPRYGTATGTNALIITVNPLFSDLYDGLTIKFKNATTNTGNVTANVNGKGVVPVLNYDGSQVAPGKMKQNSLYEITYAGTNFYLTKGGGDSSPIKRVQRGNLTMTGSSLTIDSTVLDFNINKSVVVISVSTNTSSITGTSTANNVLAEIVDNTTLRFSRNATSINNLLIEWELIEFENDVNIQTGTIDLTGTSVNVSISNVDTNKSILYFSFNSSAVGEYSQSTNGKINDSTTLSFRRGSDAGINKIRWFVVEIK